MKTCIIAMVAASIMLLGPASAADSGFDRATQQAEAAIEQVTYLPLVTYDEIEGHAPVRLSRHLPIAHRIVRGIASIPRDVVDGAENDLRAMVTRSAIAHGVPVALAHGVVRLESGYRCSAHNVSGASGIMQVLPRTAVGVGVHGSLRSCSAGLEAGMRYLAQAWRRSGGSFCGAATLYNQGIGGHWRCSAYGRQVVGLASI